MHQTTIYFRLCDSEQTRKHHQPIVKTGEAKDTRNSLNRTLHQAPQGRGRIQNWKIGRREVRVNNIIYIVGAVVIVLVILSFVGIG